MGKGGGGGSYISGWKYYLTMLFALAHWIDALIQIRFSDKVAWDGNKASGRIEIDEEELFGGEDGEGGVSGEIDLLPGDSDQGAITFLESKTDVPHPAYRGIVTALFRGFMVASVNPYPKAPIFVVRQTTSDFLPGLAEIGDGSKNPAHIIWGMLTSEGGTKYYGLHLGEDGLDIESFQIAAQKLYDEGFGLDGCWDNNSESIEDFISDILNYIDGILFPNPSTGKLVLRLIRDDYDAASLTIYDESTISELVSFVRSSPDDLTNQVELKWRELNLDDGDVFLDRIAYVQDLGNMRVTGQVLRETFDLPYISTSELAQKVAERICHQKSYPLAAVEFKGNLSLSRLLPGDVIKWSWAELGIEEMVLRVSKVKLGSLTEGTVTIIAGEDIYGLPYNIVAGSGGNKTESPVLGPVDCPYRKMEELPYYVIVKDLTDEETLWDALEKEPTTGACSLMASRPNGSCMGLRLYEYDPEDAGYVQKMQQYFAPTGLLTAAISETDTEISVEQMILLDRISVGNVLLLGSELILVTEIDSDTDANTATITISRGVLDTVPQAHVLGERFFAYWSKEIIRHYACTGTNYLAGEVVRFKACPKTPRGTLSLADASENTLVMRARIIRPYPPANVRINGVYYPAGLEDLQPIVVTWDNRNRLDQTGYVIEQNEGNIDPEDGTTINISLYDIDSGSLIHSETGVAATARTWTYAIATEIAERGTAAGNAMICKVEAVRDGYTSWQAWEIPIPARLIVAGVCILAESGDYIVTEDEKYITME